MPNTTRKGNPDFLGGDNKALVDYSWKMKKAHGKATKSYIKYDSDFIWS